MKNTDKAFASLIATVEVVVVIALLLFLASMDKESNATSSNPDYLPSPTLAEMNDYAYRIGKDPIESLPWEDEFGRNIYDVRQQELAEIGLIAYRNKYAQELR